MVDSDGIIFNSRLILKERKGYSPRVPDFKLYAQFLVGAPRLDPKFRW